MMCQIRGGGGCGVIVGQHETETKQIKRRPVEKEENIVNNF